jgi:hypothetical protein
VLGGESNLVRLHPGQRKARRWYPQSEDHRGAGEVAALPVLQSAGIKYELSRAFDWVRNSPIGGPRRAVADVGSMGPPISQIRFDPVTRRGRLCPEARIECPAPR